MHHRRRTPAQQLASRALRYCQPLSRPARASRWRLRSTAEPETSSKDEVPAPVHVRDAVLARVEAVLFLAKEPISTRKLAQFANLADGTEARTLIRRLNAYYDEGGSAFRIEEVAGGFQMLTRPKFGPWLRRLFRSPIDTRLSPPAMEALAVVAYRQPVLRVDIEEVRGVQCSEILRQLMERDLVRIAGRSPELGRPFLYGTTRRFLQVFGLRHLDDLPRAAALRKAAQSLPGAVAASAESAG